MEGENLSCGVIGVLTKGEQDGRYGDDSNAQANPGRIQHGGAQITGNGCKSHCGERIGKLCFDVVQVIAGRGDAGHDGCITDGGTMIAKDRPIEYGGTGKDGERQSAQGMGEGNDCGNEDGHGGPGGSNGKGDQSSEDEDDQGQQAGRQVGGQGGCEVGGCAGIGAHFFDGPGQDENGQGIPDAGDATHPGV